MKLPAAPSPTRSCAASRSVRPDSTRRSLHISSPAAEADRWVRPYYCWKRTRGGRVMARIAAPMKAVMGCAVGLALIGAACATKSPSAAGRTTPAPTATGGGTGGYGGYGGGYGGSSQGSAVTAATVQQGPGGQFVFSPVRLTVTKGQTVDVKNVSSVSHTFTIQGRGIDVVNNGGQSQKVEIDLAPGTYTFVCRFHQSLLMQGTLIVKG